MRRVPKFISVGLCVAAVLVGACKDLPMSSASPVGPTGGTLTTGGTFTLSGVVAEVGRHIENVGVEVWWATSSSSSSGRDGSTDAEGRYRIDGLSPGETVWAIARKEGYVQQCAATATIQANATLDVGLTSLANLSTARPASGPNSRTVSGVVYEATPSGKQPVAGASVDWVALYYESVAYTRSDATGRYLLCGLPQGPISGLFVTKQGYRFSRVSVEPGLDATVDIEIIRE